MNPLSLVTLLQFAAVLHLGLLWAGASMPKAVNLRAALVPLPPFIRRLFYVYLGFIALILAGFGLLTFLYAAPMAAGEPVARALCILMAVFWSIRLLVAAVVFDMRPYLRTLFHRIGYFALNSVFVYLVVLYAYVAWRGGHA
jgi:hypothetical protein